MTTSDRPTHSTAVDKMDAVSEKDDAGILKNGSANDIRDLVQRMWGSLVSNAQLIVADKQTAQDVVQEAFIRALAHIDDFEQRRSGSLDAWIKRIVINQAISTLRSVNRRQEDSLEAVQANMDKGIRIPEASALTQCSTEDVVANIEMQTHIFKAIKALAEPLRVTLYLRDIEGYSTKEAALALGTTEGNIRARVHRARLALKARLERTLMKGNS